MVSGELFYDPELGREEMWFAGQKFTGQEIASLGTTIHKKHLWEKETRLLAGLALAVCLHQQQPMFLVTQCGNVTLNGDLCSLEE